MNHFAGAGALVAVSVGTDSPGPTSPKKPSSRLTRLFRLKVKYRQMTATTARAIKG